MKEYVRNKPESIEDVETRPDGWKRFAAAVDAAAKTGPKPLVKKQKHNKNNK